ncbi:maleate cis-trans isomerase family protein [Methylobacterium nodulans]|uniref:Asp/Glu/hydantoin racemase n=1 Tax=Methylobacterium nodulans (strain LMG 21967 / CNCM I-2342 / ORS 2060) TaxID=460265 RepID=B8IWQ0_METNO|nr:aspartate/glutamate racemase family protein [Methylobacterium nodulans]ACL62941.1 Asp/Glu/hydantoin racemase [Methylobacterium nodulans ORS 2060]
MTVSHAPKPIRLGMLTPSSNTVLEPVLARMTAQTDISVHYSRFRVTEISLSQQGLGQFAFDAMVQAAELLAHAKVDVIAWNGTSAGWLGFPQDEELCARITATTGILATSSVLAFRDAFRSLGTKRVGLVTPYTTDVQRRITANWEAAGFPCTAERHLGLADNFSFAETTGEVIADLVRQVARDGCEAAAIVCTNMRGAAVAPMLERELGIPVIDSVAVTLWASLRLIGAATGDFVDWGQIFSISNAASGASLNVKAIA